MPYVIHFTSFLKLIVDFYLDSNIFLFIFNTVTAVWNDWILNWKLSPLIEYCLFIWLPVSIFVFPWTDSPFYVFISTRVGFLTSKTVYDMTVSKTCLIHVFFCSNSQNCQKNLFCQEVWILDNIMKGHISTMKGKTYHTYNYE